MTIEDVMKKNLFLLANFFLLFAANAFCKSSFQVNENHILIDKREVPHEIQKSLRSYKFDFIGNNKIECFTIYEDDGRMRKEKEYTLELEKKAEDSAVLKIFRSDDSLEENYQITFAIGNKIKINRDEYILRDDSYAELKNNILKNGEIKELLEFLKATLFFYNDFCYFNFLVFMPQKSNVIKYFILSASLHFSSGQSSWIYDYEARYTYKDNLIDELIIVDEDGEMYLKQKLEEKNDDYLVYKLFKRISEGCSTHSYFFIDLENNMAQESGTFYKSCYEYPYLKSLFIIDTE